VYRETGFGIDESLRERTDNMLNSSPSFPGSATAMSALAFTGKGAMTKVGLAGSICVVN